MSMWKFKAQDSTPVSQHHLAAQQHRRPRLPPSQARPSAIGLDQTVSGSAQVRSWDAACSLRPIKRWRDEMAARLIRRGNCFAEAVSRESLTAAVEACQQHHRGRFNAYLEAAMRQRMGARFVFTILCCFACDGRFLGAFAWWKDWRRGGVEAAAVLRRYHSKWV
ncbi:hypothetical protein BU26DRAFT_227125 [Trematosphaeria pertusa]|uniref:Uncharacterized protein n=1 Tax=Trematosphaeria pertusa TaxID=390896 RepID=A0A6A6IVK6_9PLEO|nr:uncharacterized protein BU26DRAFT_227125 [Trematosphaeria pertusa]KAF2253650.1 hypothetical protein BU26DRAFT_227125 [Trematosphaeria pertusa]